LNFWNPTNRHARLTAAGFCGFLTDFVFQTWDQPRSNAERDPDVSNITQELHGHDPFSGQHEGKKKLRGSSQ